MFDSLPLHGLQLARLPCPSLPPGIFSNSCPLSWWCLLTHLILFHPFFLFSVHRKQEVRAGSLWRLDGCAWGMFDMTWFLLWQNRYTSSFPTCEFASRLQLLNSNTVRDSCTDHPWLRRSIFFFSMWMWKKMSAATWNSGHCLMAEGRLQRKEHFSRLKYLPFSLWIWLFQGKQKTTLPPNQRPNKQTKKNHIFFFNWIGQTQGLLLKKKEERKEKWLPHPSVLICAYLMINNTLWSIVWCGLCWFEQENTESLLRHLWITSVYPETINERGRLKKNKKNTQICWVLWLKTGDNVGSQSLLPCVGPTAFSHRMKIVLSDHDWAFWIL